MVHLLDLAINLLPTGVSCIFGSLIPSGTLMQLLQN